MNNKLIMTLTSISLLGCASFIKNYNEDELKTQEFESKLQIEQVTVSEIKKESLVQKVVKKTIPLTKVNSSKKPSKVVKAEDKKIAKKSTTDKAAVRPNSKSLLGKEEPPLSKAVTSKHQPAFEDGTNFNGRRPIVEPLRVGEKVVLGLSYFAVEAGKLSLEVKPFVNVNGKKSWHFYYHSKTSSLFSMFYKVNDTAEAYMDYNELKPYSYEVHVKESKQVKEVRSLFDWKNMRAQTWDKTLKKGKKLKKEEFDWKLLPFSQNVFTVPFYLRNFNFKVGETLSVRVAHEGKNILMKAFVAKREVISTKLGKMKAVLIKPKFQIDGIFKQTGDISMWLSDDDRKFILRIESKIKIGTIVASVQEIKK